jgi:hypothetical protein
MEPTQMSAKSRIARSYLPISAADLEKLADIARHDRKDFFLRRPEYRAKVLLVALCQGAALHYLDGRNGIKDFDVRYFGMGEGNGQSSVLAALPCI